MQSASLCLTTTPPEELAGALRALLAPARLLGAPVADIGLTLLLSLRFMALVFDEARNLALGLAARGVAWAQLGPGGNLQARAGGLWVDGFGEAAALGGVLVMQ